MKPLRSILLFCLLCLTPAALCAQVRPTASRPTQNIASVRPYLMAQLGHSGPLSSLAFSPDGRYVLTGGYNVACLWETATGKEVRQFQGHSRFISSVAFSPDGRYVLTGSVDKTVRLWEAATGKEVRRYVDHSSDLYSDYIYSSDAYCASFSPDGRYVLTGGGSVTCLWETATGKEVRQFQGHSRFISSVAFSPDGRYVLTGEGNVACLWKTATGKEIRQYSGHSGSVYCIAFSPDGRYILTGSEDKTARLWEAATGKEIRQYSGHSGVVSGVAFSADGRYVLTGSEDKTARLWETATGKEVWQLQGNGRPSSSVAFSPDGRYILTGSGDSTARLWETATGKLIRIYRGRPSNSIQRIAFSPDGRYILTGSEDKTARLWETATGKEVRQFQGHSGSVYCIAFSPDGRYVLTGSRDSTARLWETATGKEVRQFQGHSRFISSVAFSPDGRYVLTGSVDNIACLWETATGKEIRRFEGHSGSIGSVAFSPDGRYILTGSEDKTARLWETATGKEVRQFWGHTFFVSSVAFSPDGQFALTGSGNVVRLWETETAKEVRQFQGHSNPVLSVAFSPDGRYVLTGSVDCTTRIWETVTGRELCALISFTDGNWAVVDSEGRYDASDPDKLEGLYWVVGNEPIDLWQLKARYYDPGLLAKVLGYNKEPLRNVQPFNNVAFYPDIKLNAPPSGGTKLGIVLTNRQGGIGAVQVWVNGKEFVADARGPKPDVNAPQAKLTLDLSHAPGLQPGQPNEIRVTARNGEGYLQSRGVTLLWTPPGRAAPAVRPQLYAIVAGIGEYASPNLHLNLPPRDAAQMATAITLGAKRLFGADKVHLTLLSSDTSVPNALPPTKANFRQAFEAIRKAAKPDDILVVYLAGHGVAIADAYYYLTTEARSFDLSDPAVRQSCSLSDGELASWTTGIAALKQVMVLDTCAAGSAAHKLAEKRDISGDQIRAIDRLKDRTGFYVLMGCASDAVSYEASQYGQGLLTYALLAAMQGEKLRDGEFVDVSLLFEYAADRVPQLAEGIGGIQRPQILTPTTHSPTRDKQQASFPIGQMTLAEKRAIVLPQPRPRVLRPNLLNRERVKDDLELSAALRKWLREHSEGTGRGNSAPIYLDVEPEDLPDALVPSGLYTVSGETITVDLVVSRNGKDSKVTVMGSKSDIPALAAKLADAIASGIADKQP